MDADQAAGGLTLFGVRRMMEGVVPPVLCTVAPDGMPNATYVSLAEYVDADHVALSFQFLNTSRENLLATRRAALSLDDPYTAAGVTLQLAYLRTETAGPVFERLRAKLAGIASHLGMDKVFHLRGADIYRVLELRAVPGRRELPAALPRCDLAGNARILSERLAACRELPALVEATLGGLDELLRIDHSMLWVRDPTRPVLVLLASRGYARGGTGAEIALGEGLAGIAAQEGVPIRVGHMMNMQTYGRAARDRASALGVAAPVPEIPLPGLAEPRSQLAVPLRSRGCVLGVLFVESRHDQYFGYDDEDALTLLAGQLAVAMSLMSEAEPAAEAAPAPAGVGGGPPVRLRRYPYDNSLFLDDAYLIRGVAGAVLWKVAREHLATGRSEFTHRELRLAAELGLPEVADNLEVRLLLLQRRLAENDAAIRIEKSGRGRFRLLLSRPLVIEEVGAAA